MIQVKDKEGVERFISENQDFIKVKNSNGVAFQFPNGLQICLKFLHHEFTPSALGNFGYYNWSNVWTFPIPFKDTYPFVNLVSIAGSGFWTGNVVTDSNGITSALLWNNGAGNLCKSNLVAIAIGNYKENDI